MKLKDIMKEELIFKNIKITNDNLKDGKIPLMYKKVTVHGSFRCEYTKITSMENFPNKIERECLVENNTLLTSFEFGPMEFNSGYFYDNPVTSLTGIGKKYFRTVYDALYLPGSVKQNVLGILLINNLQFFAFDKVQIDDEDNEDLAHSQLILNDHLKSKDIMECREELVQAGLKEFAKL